MIVLIFAVLASSCSSYYKLKRFEQSDFELIRIEDIKIANIDISRIRSFNDFNQRDLAKLTESFIKKELPLSLTFVVEITNHAKKEAILERLDYIVTVNNKDILSGELNERIVVKPNVGSETFFVKSELEIIGLFDKDELEDNIKAALRLLAADNIYDEINLRVRPYIRVGNQFSPYTQYIRVKHK